MFLPSSRARYASSLNHEESDINPLDWISSGQWEVAASCAHFQKRLGLSPDLFPVYQHGIPAVIRLQVRVLSGDSLRLWVQAVEVLGRARLR